MKYNIIVADPPYVFSDKLKMDNVPRGAEANYSLLKDKDLLNLDIKNLAAKDAILALWVPSSLLTLGLDIMNSWDFTHKQTYIWTKTKKDPLSSLKKKLLKFKDIKEMKNFISKDIDRLFVNEALSFGMGRIMRNCHEIALIGTRGKILSHLKNKSQRTVSFESVKRHSEKPEDLQNSLDLMFPDPALKRIEIFARRSRKNWTCVGLESPETLNQDVRDSIKSLIEKED